MSAKDHLRGRPRPLLAVWTAIGLALATSAALAQSGASPTPTAPAKPATATTTTAAKKTGTVAMKPPLSPCKGLVETSCKSNTVCSWIVPKKAADKTGKPLKAYCRLVAGVAKPSASADKAADGQKTAAKAATKPKQ